MAPVKERPAPGRPRGARSGPSGRGAEPVGRILWAYDRGQALEHPLLCGVDEAGRGPLAGNVVAACVILDLDRAPLDALNDSKQLLPEKREELYPRILECALGYGIAESSPEEIDAINILQASLLAMRRALESLARVPSLVLVDGRQRIPGLAWPQRCLVRGDATSACIAAASVLAKVTRDRQMRELHLLHPQYGFDRHKGYATRRHRSALEEHGLTPFHRRSFCLDRAEQMGLFAAAAGESHPAE